MDEPTGKGARSISGRLPGLATSVSAAASVVAPLFQAVETTLPRILLGIAALIFVLGTYALDTSLLSVEPEQRRPWSRRAKVLVLTLVAVSALSVGAWGASQLEPSDCQVSRPDGPGTCAFSEKLTPIDAAYFTMTSMTTTGYGDIHAISPAARLLVMVELVVAFLLVTYGLSRLGSAED